VKVIQHSFVPDNDRERVLARPSVPVAKCISGRWCWLEFGSDGDYKHNPALEAILLGARQAQKAA
jgi:hypothetical protein